MSEQNSPSFWRSKVGYVCVGFLAIAAFFLITEHTAHVLGVFPWLLLAACPLMHRFMHHNHGGNRDAADHSRHADHDTAPGKGESR